MNRRIAKVAEAIKRVVSEVVHNETHDKRLKGFITITKVKVTPDLKLAKIYYSVLGDEKMKKRAMHGLKSAKNFIRARVSESLELRYTPDILLMLDESAEYAERIDTILNKIHEEEGDDERDRQDSESDQEI